MKKHIGFLCLALCTCIISTNAFAQEVKSVPTAAQAEILKDDAAVNKINMDVEITTAEFIIAIMYGTPTDLPMVMDTHYAMPAMTRADQLGIIDLKAYPMETWSAIMPKEEKAKVLENAMRNNGVDIEKVYSKLNQILVNKVEVADKPVNFNGLRLTHYRGKLMLPIRAVAEAMGFDVAWNAKDYSCTLNNGVIKSTVQIGFDSYNYSSVKAIGMSAPFSAGAAPTLIEGSFYVPIDYFSMFANVKIADSTAQFTLK